MLEFGAGGSTKYLSPRVRHLVSIEHDSDWAAAVSKLGLPNVDLVHVPPEPPATPGGIPGYRRYTEFPRSLGRSFDVVLVDGRNRVECALAGADLLRPDGVILFHDFFPRRRYHTEALCNRLQLVDGVFDTEQTLAVFMRREP